MKVFISKLAATKISNLLTYLDENWGGKVKKEFLLQLNSKINFISKHPESFPESSEFKGLHKCIVTKHNALYYRINNEKNEIEIITMFDTRQDWDKFM